MPESGTTRSILLGWAKALFTPVALAFLAWFIWQSRSELAELVSQASVAYLAIAVIAWCALHLLLPVFATTVLGGCGSTVSWWQAFSTHAGRLPARYLPGGVWHTVGRVMDYHELAVKPRHLGVFVLLENGLSAAVSLCIGGAIVALTREPGAVSSVAVLSSLLGLVALMALPYVVNRRVLQDAERFPAAAYAKAVAVILLFWVGASAAFLSYIGAFPGGGYSAIELAGVYLFSWGIGFVAIFAPQGIGVFEVVASELMDSPIGFMGLAALIAGFRVIVLVADLVTWSVYQLLRRRFGETA